MSSETLAQRHRAEWEASTVCTAIIDRNVWTIEDSTEVDKLLNRNTKKRWQHSDNLVPGWAVAGVDPKTGERTYRGCQFKPDSPPKDAETGKARKYYSPSQQTLSPLFLGLDDSEYWAKLLTDTNQAIAICEGAKKAGALLTQGIPAISIPGVSTGAKLGRLRPELEAFCTYGRKFLLCFDRDIIDKRPVQMALHNLGRLLASKGCVVEVVEWPNQFKGIDDYLAADGDVRPRIESAQTLEEWREEQRQQDPNEGETCSLARRYEMVARRLKGRLRWNALKGKVELDGEPVEMNMLRIHLALHYNIQLPNEDCTQIALYLAQQSTFSPVVEYLKDCAAAYPPDSDLLDEIAATYLGTDDPLHQCFIRKTLISAVARALTPGCKVDTVCILQGIQGCGKSTFWKILASEPWFDDTVTNASDKDERLKLHQAWFLEWAELESIFKRRDISTVKAFITTQSDVIRPPYGRDFLEMPRPSIIVGSTNETEFLADPTGNRRYWVVPVAVPSIDLDKLTSERDRIWAAAVHALKAGESWQLPEEMRQAARADSDNYTTSDPWEDLVLGYCEEARQVTVAEVLTNALKLEIHQMDKRAEMRLTKILRGSGWGSSREVVHGRRVRTWKNPKFTEVGCPGCPEGAETQEPVSGQPHGQPLGQPPGQPPEKPQESPPQSGGLNSVDNLDNLDNLLPKTSGKPECGLLADDPPLIKTMDVVEIRSGRFEGMRVAVVSIDGDRVEVKAASWAISREYALSEVRLVEKAVVQ